MSDDQKMVGSPDEDGQDDERQAKAPDPVNSNIDPKKEESTEDKYVDEEKANNASPMDVDVGVHVDVDVDVDDVEKRKQFEAILTSHFSNCKKEPLKDHWNTISKRKALFKEKIQKWITALNDEQKFKDDFSKVFATVLLDEEIGTLEELINDIYDECCFRAILTKHFSNCESKRLEKALKKQLKLISENAEIFKQKIQKWITALNDEQKFKDDFSRVFENVVLEEEIVTLEELINGIYNDCCEAGLAERTAAGVGDRVTALTLGLDQTYQGKFDLEQFHQRISETFEWFDKDHAKYFSPSFAIIQSSGMGKTKLMKQYKKAVVEKRDENGPHVLLLLCIPAEKAPPSDHAKHFDNLLHVPNIPLNSTNEGSEAERKKFLDLLDTLVNKATEERIVLLMDEAQSLVKRDKGRLYVAVRWWLRQRRTKQVVAVFAGTLLSLANYQLTNPPLGSTRDPITVYVNYADGQEEKEAEKELYDPFYTLTTVAMEHARVAEGQRDEYIDELHDIRKCGLFGRPLFVAMLKKDPKKKRPELGLQSSNVHVIERGGGRIVNGQLYNIMARVLLSDTTDWKESQQSVASVLATRVQLGVASYKFAMEATSKGYANLVHFRGGRDTSDDRSFGAASIVFPPDPVCAALAMGLMQDSWSLSKAANSDMITGAPPEFWVEKASLVFESHLFLPERGDAGEVLAALYMLLCGDELRKKRDACMRKFEIELNSWLVSLVEAATSKKPKKRKKADERTDRRDAGGTEGAVRTVGPRRSARVAKLRENPASTASDSPSGFLNAPPDTNLKLNFIQVVRNYFRTHAWFSQEYLKYLYDSAVACYVFANCPAFDLVFAISNGDKYHPALVSVKCWDAIGASDMKGALNDMKQYVEGYRDENKGDVKAFCILVVIGSQEVGTKPIDEGRFPEEDAFVTIVVPKNDKFGVTDAIVKSATASVRAEALASHSFAHVEDQNYNALRASPQGKDRDFGWNLIDDQQSGSALAVEEEAESTHHGMEK